MKIEERYSFYNQGKIPMEVALLLGKGCFYKKCRFCDYHLDSASTKICETTNEAVLAKVTGELGRIAILNSGSYFELPGSTRAGVKNLLIEKKIKHLHIESHWKLRKKVLAFVEEMKNYDVMVHPRIGIETFDEEFREKVMNKGMGYKISPECIAKYFTESCLLFGIKGQSINVFEQDVKIAKQYFNHVYINIFTPNSTPTQVDENLIKWFETYALPELNKDENITVFKNKTDLGVGN